MTAIAGGYSNLEFDLDTGTRGSRTDHCRALLRRVTGAEDGLVVNNAAGALVLALNALAAGRDVLVSRGELIEIGGSFRIPDIMARSGARLREVGTTNRTHLDDYRRALDDNVALILDRAPLELRAARLRRVARARGARGARGRGRTAVPVRRGERAAGRSRPLGPHVRAARGRRARRRRRASCCFSGDKLLGGPQAGCLVGRARPARPLPRESIRPGLRADKLTLAALEATLALYEDPETAARVSVLRMLTAEAADLAARAARLAEECPAELHAELRPGESAVGGGAFPGAVLPTTLVALDPGELGADGLALRLRLGEPALVARVADGRVLLDPRTLPEDAAPEIRGALARALRNERPAGGVPRSRRHTDRGPALPARPRPRAPPARRGGGGAQAQ